MLRGTTTLLPTTVCNPPEELERIFAALTATRATQHALPYMPGLHIEGPWINPKQAGAQDPRYILVPTEESTDAAQTRQDVARVTAAWNCPAR